MQNEIQIKPRDHAWYGWRRGLPDFKDRKYLYLRPPETLPAKVDLRKHCPPVMNQDAIGSCVAHAVTAALRYDRVAHQNLPDVILSRLQLYYDTRYMEGTVAVDAGCEIRDAIKCATKYGVAPERDWPYDIKRFADRPPFKAYFHGLWNQAVQYQSVAQTVPAIKSALAQGHPVVFGISIYESFESKEVEKTGIITLPQVIEKGLGGHAMYLHGYGNHDPAYADGRNSWDTDWGDKGDFHIPFDYLTDVDLAGDFWVITRVD